MEGKWTFYVGEGNLASLVFPLDNPDAVRIAIARVATSLLWDIQLNEPRLKLKSTHRYVVSFLARADRPRSICCGVAKAYSPWNNLGLYRQVELSTEWQSFEDSFVAIEDEHNARIHFDVGGNDRSVEVSAVSLRSLTEGQFVTPDLRPPLQGLSASTKGPGEPAIPVGKAEFGSFRTVTPISRDWGFDRGLPIDRYYVEGFLARHAGDIRGRALEISDNAYTRRFGGRHVIKSDVLYPADGNPRATLMGDLTTAEHIPSSTFDCVILTQTLHVIYDLRAALRTLHRILKPGGVLLATFPGISKIYHDEWAGPSLWGLTAASTRRLFDEAVAPGRVEVEAYGNVLAAISFLHGLAAEELRKEELDCLDPDYQVLIAVRAVKSGA